MDFQTVATKKLVSGKWALFFNISISCIEMYNEIQKLNLQTITSLNNNIIIIV